MKISPIVSNNFCAKIHTSKNKNKYISTPQTTKQEPIKTDKRTRTMANIALAAMATATLALNSGCSKVIQDQPVTIGESKTSADIREEVFNEYDKETGITRTIKVTFQGEEILKVEKYNYLDGELYSTNLIEEAEGLYTITTKYYDNQDFDYTTKEYFIADKEENIHIQKVETTIGIDDYLSVCTYNYDKNGEKIESFTFDADNDGIAEMQQNFEKDKKIQRLTDQNGDFAFSSTVKNKSKLTYTDMEISFEDLKNEDILSYIFDEKFDL